MAAPLAHHRAIASAAVLLTALATSSADSVHEIAFRYRNVTQPTRLDNTLDEGRRAWFRAHPVFGVRISEYGPGPLSSFARVVWAILFANQVGTDRFSGRPVYTSTDVRGAASSYLSFDYSAAYMQIRLQTELNPFFGFRVGWWLMSGLETDLDISDLPPMSATAEFLRDEDATIARGRAGGEALMVLQLPLHVSEVSMFKIGMELNPVSFLNLMDDDSADAFMRYLGYPRTFAQLDLTAGIGTLRVTGLIPNRFWLVPWYASAAELNLEAGIRF